MSGPLLLAVDAGGSSTRALVVEPDGTCRGAGLGPAGNPTSAGPEVALASVAAAARAALAQAGRAPSALGAVLVAMAGARSLMPAAALAAAVGFGGEPARVRTAPDIAAMYHSGAAEPVGCAVVAGTGSVAARVRDGEVAGVAGGSGWLLGDGGSGFALGHAVVRAAVADLDGSGPATALTDLLLAARGTPRGGPGPDGRPAALARLVESCYAERPVALARHAPLAFAAPEDPVARRIVAAAQDDVAALVAAVRADGWPGPLVLGGSALRRGLLAPGRPVSAALREALAGADVRTATDGAVGAAVLALLRWGPDGGPAAVPADVDARLRATAARVRPAAGAAA